MLLKFEEAFALIPDKSGSLMKLIPVGGAGSAMLELNIMAGPEGGVTTHSCCPGSTVHPMVKKVMQLKSTTSPGDAQASLGTVRKSAVGRCINLCTSFSL